MTHSINFTKTIFFFFLILKIHKPTSFAWTSIYLTLYALNLNLYLDFIFFYSCNIKTGAVLRDREINT